MTQEEIIQAITNDKTMPFIQPEHLADIVDFVIKNYTPSLPSNLDEAANRQAALEQPYKWEEEQDGSFGVTPLFVMSNIRSVFKSGAVWVAGQGISYDATISADKTIPVLPMKDVSNMGLDYGDNVTVQLWKK